MVGEERARSICSDQFDPAGWAWSASKLRRQRQAHSAWRTIGRTTSRVLAPHFGLPPFLMATREKPSSQSRSVPRLAKQVPPPSPGLGSNGPAFARMTAYSSQMTTEEPGCYWPGSDSSLQTSSRYLPRSSLSTKASSAERPSGVSRESPLPVPQISRQAEQTSRGTRESCGCHAGPPLECWHEQARHSARTTRPHPRDRRVLQR